jgi:transglutaminase-like putative cysteine protease
MGFFFKSRGGFTMAGFNDSGVKLGGHGRIKMDSTIVMRVEVPAKYGGRGAPSIHWRGVTFDHYSNGTWMRSAAAPPTTTYYEQLRGRLQISIGEQPFTPSELQKTGVRQDIWLEPLESTVLFGASRPLVFEVDRGVVYPIRRDDHRGDELRMAKTPTSTTHYQAWSELEPPPADWLRAAPHLEPHELPDNIWVYLQLPDEITARTRALARSITEGLTNDFDRATAIMAWLRTNLTYTLELADPPGQQEHVDFFLFDRKKGHCEFFASAFAVLARSLDIPTRNVNGFLGGEWNEYDDYVAVRAGDAHSWAEVYFSGFGWVTFDATPSAQDRLGRGGDGILAKLRRFLDTIRFQWSKWVIEYDLYRQLALFRAIGRVIKQGAIAVKDAVVFAARWIARHWYATVPLGLLAMLLLVRWLRRRARTRGEGDRGYVKPRRRRPVAVVYHQAIDKLGKRGLVRDPALTPREIARRWGDRPGGVELVELTELYYAVEYGTASEGDTLPRARVLRDAIAAYRS